MRRGHSFVSSSDQELLDLLLDGGDLPLDLRALVLGDGGGDDWPGDATGVAILAQSMLAPDKGVQHVLVLAQQWDVQENLVRQEPHELGLNTVEPHVRISSGTQD